jgi:anaerobic C4-dicarboxylate transporter DcuA
MLAVILFFASTLLYSQAATTKALMPAALMLGVSPITAVASFAAVSALFVLPTYPTLLAAVEMDDTGSTRIGKFVFNHSFIVPGTLAIALSVLFGFIFGHLIL